MGSAGRARTSRDEDDPDDEGAEGASRLNGRSGAPPRRKLGNRVAAVSRWLHIYLSMFGLFALLFFSLTGITLNHPDWFFGRAQARSEVEGRVDPRWVKPGDDAPVSKLDVVEFLRKSHGVRGALVEFTTDERECVVTFKGPGYSADAFLDRETGTYRLSETYQGFLAVVNDLHKGRDTGTAWSVVLDLSAALMSVASLTGLVLLFTLKRRRGPGLLAALVGTALVVAVVVFCVP